ncbi:hypothetical protein A2303_04800 [Candidatus Falkowbacteria bacterium RIFOXYB2_FULL_47_14]|uniref:Ribulose-phosphate 3-epimerase n=1 Tax=Candidatus Falkowbacteria bacterium RIFOXYA2_FULL_47_19 TaxID=1797994 RepID=A0A1F5SII3_9BACT|nr:MAG: hypothetical protein A2227_02635 [Candidatus Falkowbacteria bacterium RIFOXYA2_FULL_47_19]OGF35821.1 MAG: hypothetical protein A2468_03820 [Candidatus Falkowbacteria bacterium RIFOXYC2_FULL_46_15]OGF42694.1 MAG: hypothetical protein A2303_04800 [Candidatus Falkowbacteria bacterium RIFOXYB2_FULL_47_14]
MITISPSLLAASGRNLKTEIKKLESSGADWLHIDVMDGKFVPQTTAFYPALVKKIKQWTKLPLDAHLMTENADNLMTGYIRAGADCISVHVESKININNTIRQIKKRGRKAGLAVNPGTPLEKIYKFLPYLDYVLIMSVVPGKCGQAYIKNSTAKIKNLKKYIREKNLKTLTQVDGGIKADNAYLPINAGADILVSGSGILGAKNYQEVISKIKNTILIGSDHGGYKLKEKIKNILTENKLAVEDLGCYSPAACDYPDIAHALSRQISGGVAQRGILICTTGIGMSIAANRHYGVRAALCADSRAAKMSRRHNDSNVLVLGQKSIKADEVEKIINTWLNELFEGGRHQRRVSKIEI